MKILHLQLHLIITLHQSYFGTKTRVEFNGSCLKQDRIMYNHGRIVTKVPNNIPRNPPFCSFASFLIVLLTPFINKPD